MSQARTCKSCGGWIFDTPILGITNIKMCRCPGPDQNGLWPRPNKPKALKCTGCGWPIDAGKETRGTDNNWYHPACNPGMQVNPVRQPVTEDDVRRIVREELKRMIDK